MTAVICLRVRTRALSYGFHETRVLWQAKKLLASQEGPCCIEWVSYMDILEYPWVQENSYI